MPIYRAAVPVTHNHSTNPLGGAIPEASVTGLTAALAAKAPVDGSYLTFGTSATLTGDRVLSFDTAHFTTTNGDGDGPLTRAISSSVAFGATKITELTLDATPAMLQWQAPFDATVTNRLSWGTETRDGLGIWTAGAPTKVTIVTTSKVITALTIRRMR